MRGFSVRSEESDFSNCFTERFFRSVFAGVFSARFCFDMSDRGMSFCGTETSSSGEETVRLFRSVSSSDSVPVAAAAKISTGWITWRIACGFFAFILSAKVCLAMLCLRLQPLDHQVHQLHVLLRSWMFRIAEYQGDAF